MRQQQFEALHGAEWEEMEALLDAAPRGSGRRTANAPDPMRLPRLYRLVCGHYAAVRSRHYSPALAARLRALVLRGHRRLYRRSDPWLWRIIGFFVEVFPATLRRYQRYFWLSLLLFVGPGLFMGFGAYFNPDLIYSVLPAENVAQMEAMYDPASRQVGRTEARAAETDFQMFGFYIKNNIGIGFRTFAGGMLAGLGTLFFLVFNGLVLGGVAGHLTRLGYTETFWPFVSGHGAFELTAIVICGAAGLVLAHAIVNPGQATRPEALKRAARPALVLAMGAAGMLLVAAFVEAFWSPAPLPPTVKFAVAGALWALVAAYLTWMGRGRFEAG